MRGKRRVADTLGRLQGEKQRTLVSGQLLPLPCHGGTPESVAPRTRYAT